MLSAYAAHFYSNNTAVCAIGGKQGLYVTGTQNGIQVFSEYLAISAYSPKLGVSVASPVRALSAYSGFIGADIFSENKAILARGLKIGLEVSSPVRALSAYSNFIGADIFSENKAISARGLKIGLEVSSPVRAISANGNVIGVESYSNNISISSYGGTIGLHVKSPNKAIYAIGNAIGVESYSTTRAISAFGSLIGLEVASPIRAISAYSGFVGADIFSENKAISARGLKIGLEVSSPIRAISAYGGIIGIESYSLNIPLSTAFGKNIMHGWVGINNNTPTSALEVKGSTVLDGNVRITQEVKLDSNLTIFGNLSTLGNISYLDTFVTVTSAMSITNTGTGPALTVTQTGDEPIARFYDDAGLVALYVEGQSTKPGWVGIGTDNPNMALTVVGSISALSSLYVDQTITASSSLYVGHNAYINNELAVGQGTQTPMLSTTTIQSLGSEGVKVKASTGLYDIAHFSNDGNTTLSANLVIGGTVTAANATDVSSNRLANVGALDNRYDYMAGNRYLEIDLHNFTTAMLTAVGGAASPSITTGAVDVPAWVYRPLNTTDGAANCQALLGPYNNLSASPKSRSTKNWSKATVLSVRFQHPVVSAGTLRYYLGPQASTWAGGSLAVKGIGFEIVANSLFAVCHDGTTKTTAGSGVAMTTSTQNIIVIASDGAGGARWWVNGAEQTALSGGPTGDSAGSQYGFCTEAVNPTPATATFISIQHINIKSAL